MIFSKQVNNNLCGTDYLKFAEYLQIVYNTDPIRLFLALNYYKSPIYWTDVIINDMVKNNAVNVNTYSAAFNKIINRKCAEIFMNKQLMDGLIYHKLVNSNII